MDQITDKTSITDLSHIHIPKCYETYVNRAIGKSSKLLTMKEFIEKTEFKIHEESFDILFMNINDEGIPIYIDEAMLDWMGYTRNDTLVKHIKRNFEETNEYKILKNSDYTKYLKEETEKIKDRYIAGFKSNLPAPASGESARSIKHLIVMPDAFRSLCMMINTEKGKEIRKYYITLEKLVKAYNLYQSIFRCHEAERAMSCKGDKIDSLENLLIESEKKAAEERKRQEDRFNKLIGVSEKMDSKLDKVMPNYVELDNLPAGDAPQVIIMRDKDAEPGDFNLYVIRCQAKDLNKRIKKLREDYGENIHRSYTIKQPNAIAFWKNIKKTNSKHIVKASNSNWFMLKNITQKNFYTSINQADIKRKTKA
jgi:phage anti-repressor protein